MEHRDTTKKALYTLYLPINSNDGQPQPKERLAWALEEIARFAGGYTLLSVSQGAWVNNRGEICYDQVLPVQVVAPIGPESWAFLAHLVALLAQVLEQQEIFVHATPVTVVEPSPWLILEVGRERYLHPNGPSG